MPRRRARRRDPQHSQGEQEFDLSGAVDPAVRRLDEDDGAEYFHEEPMYLVAQQETRRQPFTKNRIPEESLQRVFSELLSAVEVDQQATLTAICDLDFSLSLADPSLPDCPIIGCSIGFETLTGYSRQEIVGQNCRILSRGADMDPELRADMRKALEDRQEFIGILPNIRKNGEEFKNLLHMSPMEVAGKAYFVGIQGDVTHTEIDLDKRTHVEALRIAADRIFESNIDAWIQVQAREFTIRMPGSWSELLNVCVPQCFQEEKRNFVRFEHGPESDSTSLGSRSVSGGTSASDDGTPADGGSGSQTSTRQPSSTKHTRRGERQAKRAPTFKHEPLEIRNGAVIVGSLGHVDGDK